MISIYLIIAALATAPAKGYTECMFSEPAEGRLYFGAEGKPLCFHLPNTATAAIRLIKDNKDLILTVKDQTVFLKGEHAESHGRNQSELPNSGIFNLSPAKKTQSGNYTLEEFGSNGTLLKKVTVGLHTQAPVSKPAVSYICFPPEQKKISCSSEVEGVEFGLSLDGQLLMNTSDHSLTTMNCATNTPSLAQSTAKQDKSSVTICLNGQQTGNFMCKVWNKVSRHQTVIHLTDCKDLISSIHVVAIIAGVASLLLLVALWFVIKQIYNKPRSLTVTNCNSEDEVVYTEVKVIRNIKKKQHETTSL